jgi:ABC-2 type transport system ATP-binding protein
MSSKVVDCQSLTVKYGEFTALAEFQLQLGAGEAACLIGPNGAGKSTALKVLSGLEAETAGLVSVLGERPKSAPRAWRAQLGVLPEHLGLFEALTIAEHLELTGQVFHIPTAETAHRSRELLQLLDLAPAATRFAAASSYGMRKKTALAMALLPAPRLLILDEPFEGLDPASCETILALLRKLKAKGVALLISSHMLMHVERLADEVLLLDQGRTVWRSRNLSEADLRTHYLDVVKANPLPSLEWL